MGLEEEVPTIALDGGGGHDMDAEEAFIAQAEQLFVDACLSGKAAQSHMLDAIESATPPAAVLDSQ